MSADMESVARALLANANGDKIKQNLGKFSEILSSPKGKSVVNALLSDGGEKLKKAAQDMQKGNDAAAKQMISSVLSTEDGAEILGKIISAASE